MRHRNGSSKLGRNSSHRLALLRNMASQLMDHERIITTHPKAVALRPWAERLITLAKRQDLASRRQVARDIHRHDVLQKLFDDIGPRFAKRPGGYLRILKMGTRKGDCAEMSLIELVDRGAGQAAGDDAAPAQDAPAAQSTL